jgi:hypothetical protein
VRLAETKLERDEAIELVERMRQHVDDADAVIQSWIEIDQLELGDDGRYQLSDSLSAKCDLLLDKYNELVKKWNKWCSKIAPGEIGRPLAASEAQIAQVLKLHKDAVPVRLIVDETGLGRQTVRTIIGREHRTDRARR